MREAEQRRICERQEQQQHLQTIQQREERERLDMALEILEIAKQRLEGKWMEERLEREWKHNGRRDQERMVRERLERERMHIEQERRRVQEWMEKEKLQREWMHIKHERRREQERMERERLEWERMHIKHKREELRCQHEQLRYEQLSYFLCFARRTPYDIDGRRDDLYWPEPKGMAMNDRHRSDFSRQDHFHDFYHRDRGRYQEHSIDRRERSRTITGHRDGQHYPDERHGNPDQHSWDSQESWGSYGSHRRMSESRGIPPQSQDGRDWGDHSRNFEGHQDCSWQSSVNGGMIGRDLERWQGGSRGSPGHVMHCGGMSEHAVSCRVGSCKRSARRRICWPGKGE